MRNYDLLETGEMYVGELPLDDSTQVPERGTRAANLSKLAKKIGCFLRIYQFVRAKLTFYGFEFSRAKPSRLPSAPRAGQVKPVCRGASVCPQLTSCVLTSQRFQDEMSPSESARAGASQVRKATSF